MTLAIVLLAAGKGTRMNSKKQKILHDVGGKPMVQHVFEAAENVADLPPVLVVAPGETGLHDLFGERAEYVAQEEQLGTGHATMVVRPIPSCASITPCNRDSISRHWTRPVSPRWERKCPGCQRTPPSTSPTGYRSPSPITSPGRPTYRSCISARP